MNQLFVKRHNSDSWFWVLAWIYCSIIIGFGFAPPVQDRFFDDFQEPASLALQIHVWSFSAWMCLLALQAFSAAKRRLDWHRNLGVVMLPLAAVMVSAGLVSEMQFQQRFLESGRDSSAFFAVSTTYLLAFSLLVLLAWTYRKNPPAHKRLVLIATATILGGAHLRIWEPLWPNGWFDNSFAFRLFFFFGGSLIIIAFGMAHDLLARGRLHTVYLFGAPGLLVLYVTAITLHDSPQWADWVRPILADTNSSSIAWLGLFH